MLFLSAKRNFHHQTRWPGARRRAGTRTALAQKSPLTFVFPLAAERATLYISRTKRSAGVAQG